MNVNHVQRKKMKPARFVQKYFRMILGGVIIAVILFCAVFADVITTHDPYELNLSVAKQTPSAEYILGTDDFGRDIFARLCFGARTTLLVAIGAQIISTVFGAVLGLLCGYYTKVEKIVMRILDAFSTIPNLLLILMMVSIFGTGVINMMCAMAMGSIAGIARLVRNQVLSLREKEFIESEKAMGARDIRTIFLHILPQCYSFLIVRFTSGLAGSVLSMTSLSYLGLGISPMVASWGGMVSESQIYLFIYPYMVLFPGLAISLAVFGFSLVGDGVRDLLDPKLR